MERNMEATVDILQEEAPIAQCEISSRRAQDRRLRRLQWAVIGCSVTLLALLCLTLYQVLGNVISPRAEKPEMCPQISGHHQQYHHQHQNIKKPVAHLTGTRQSTAKTKDHTLQWESKHGLAFVGGGMRYENKSIHIPKKGYYFVYSQVSLKSPYNFEDHFISQIIRLNDNYVIPEVLFSAKVAKNGHQAIYLAGLLHLTRGDQLMVNVTSVDQVDIRSNDKTFFGAFWVMDVGSP